jgi:glutamate-1-semialdehyde 2,1-aminomutase/spore coat polysaccharide biosynthesis protein SpsF
MEQNIDTVIVSQARIGSTRLPGKVLMKVNDNELLKIHLGRISKSKLFDKLIVATTNLSNDDVIVEKLEEWGYSYFRGSEENVLDRFYKACEKMNPKWVVRLTSDCPLIDSELIDAVILFTKVNDLDYCSNVLVEHFPDGQDIEVFKFSALKMAYQQAVLISELEHVTPYIRKNSDFIGGTLFKSMNFPCFSNFRNIRMTVDEQQDFDLMTKLINELGLEKSWLDYTNYIIKTNLFEMNKDIIRNEGYLKSLKKD